MKQVFILAVVFVCSIFTGCSKTAVPVDISKACAVENDGKYFVTSGFLDDKGSIFCSNIGGGRLDCSLDVIASPGGTRVFGAEIEQGSGSSEIEEMPSGYKKEDIKIRDNSGNLIKLSDKVNLTGKLSVAPGGSVCFMEVDKIEK